IGDNRRSLRSWQDRVRDPSLTVLLVLELCLVFLAGPLAARGTQRGETRVATAALSGRRPWPELSTKFGGRPTMISYRKQERGVNGNKAAQVEDALWGR